MIQWKRIAKRHDVGITPASFSDGGGNSCRGYLLTGFLGSIHAAIAEMRKHGAVYSIQGVRGVYVCKG